MQSQKWLEMVFADVYSPNQIFVYDSALSDTSVWPNFEGSVHASFSVFKSHNSIWIMKSVVGILATVFCIAIFVGRPKQSSPVDAIQNVAVWCDFSSFAWNTVIAVCGYISSPPSGFYDSFVQYHIGISWNIYRLLSFVTFLFSLQAFTGYSMNGCLIHHTSEVRSLYPSDGGVIQVETYNLNHGKVGLIFVPHIQVYDTCCCFKTSSNDGCHIWYPNHFLCHVTVIMSLSWQLSER